MNRLLFKHIDNSGLVLFRVVFGLLITIEAFGAIATGWVRRTLVEPEFTFNFIGFDFLQPLVGEGMYLYFAVMGVFGLLVMLGFKYRYAMIGYALMWTAVYLLQKTSYNNHYYLMMILCWVMAFLPANHWFSLDAKYNPAHRSGSMPRWCILVLILLVWIVYTYAAVAKLYPDWIDATVAELFMKGKKDYWLIGGFLQNSWVHYCIAYFGILFDLCIVPLLLWKRTRLFGFFVSIFFHLFNSAVFLIGIFPYMSIAFAFFFFSSETLQKRFFPSKEHYNTGEVVVPAYKNLLIGVLSVFFVVQLALPLRHWFFKDDVLWTEEGHRLSWRMMLRSKSGSLSVWVTNKETGVRQRFNHNEILSKKQRRSIKTKPDLLWQLAKRIKKMEAEKGNDVAVFMDVKVKVNGGKYYTLIDPTVDLASEAWRPLKHHDWILASQADYHEKAEVK